MAACARLASTRTARMLSMFRPAIKTHPVRHSSISTEHKDNGIVELNMNRKPSNSWNLEFLEEFCLTLEDLEHDRSCRGVIIGSSIPRVFSYGLDVSEYYQAKADRLKVFRRRYQEFWLRLYGSRLATVAAISGNSPGGGCMIALSCDFRIMAPGYRIGYNEVKGGLLAPSWFIDTMLSVVGPQITERSVQVGLMFGTEDALKAGMVDQVVPAEEMNAAAHEVMNFWLSVPDNARGKAKSIMRQKNIEKLQETREEDIRAFVARVLKDDTQKSIENLLQRKQEKGHDVPFVWGDE